MPTPSDPRAAAMIVPLKAGRPDAAQAEPAQAEPAQAVAAQAMATETALTVVPPPAVGRPTDPQLELALVDSMQRLEQIVDEETTALTARQAIDLDEINRRKSRSLLELTRLSRALPGRITGGDLGSRLERVAAKLRRNHDLLHLHLTAAQEIAALIAETMRAAESDGTYSSGVDVAGRRR